MFLHFLLLATADLDKPAWAPPAVVAEIHRMAIPAAALKPGPHEFTMIRVTRGPGKPPPPHMHLPLKVYSNCMKPVALPPGKTVSRVA